jgi:hypothetical protein
VNGFNLTSDSDFILIFVLQNKELAKQFLDCGRCTATHSWNLPRGNLSLESGGKHHLFFCLQKKKPGAGCP